MTNTETPAAYYTVVRNSDDRVLFTFTRPRTAQREAEQRMEMLRPGFARIVKN